VGHLVLHRAQDLERLPAITGLQHDIVLEDPFRILLDRPETGEVFAPDHVLQDLPGFGNPPLVDEREEIRRILELIQTQLAG